MTAAACAEWLSASLTADAGSAASEPGLSGPVVDAGVWRPSSSVTATLVVSVSVDSAAAAAAATAGELGVSDSYFRARHQRPLTG